MACQAYYITSCEILLFTITLVGAYYSNFIDEEIDVQKIIISKVMQL